MKTYRRTLFVILCLVVAGIAYTAIDIYAYSLTKDDIPTDTAIVLGAAVWNGVPSPVFEERINHAIDLYKTGQVNSIIFTGGVGEGDQLAESVSAKEYAIGQGVAEKDIYCETWSTITYENLQGALEIVEAQKMNRVLLVSDPLHMKRAMMMAKDLGLNAYPSPTPTSRYRGLRTQLGFLLREVYFYGVYIIQRFSGHATRYWTGQ